VVINKTLNVDERRVSDTPSSYVVKNLVPELTGGGIRCSDRPVGGYNQKILLVTCMKEKTSDNTLAGRVFNEVDNLVCPFPNNYDHLTTYPFIPGSVSVNCNGRNAYLYINKILPTDNGC
jgi:hypothetical protein